MNEGHRGIAGRKVAAMNIVSVGPAWVSSAAAVMALAVSVMALTVLFRSLKVSKRQHHLAALQYNEETLARARIQADRISLRTLPGTSTETGYGIPIILTNRSDLPVTQIRMLGLFKGSPAGISTEYFDLPSTAGNSEGVGGGFLPWSPYYTFVSTSLSWRDLEPGSKTIVLPMKTRYLLKGNRWDCLGIGFVDYNGKPWTRRLDGSLFEGTTLGRIYRS